MKTAKLTVLSLVACLVLLSSCAKKEDTNTPAHGDSGHVHTAIEDSTHSLKDGHDHDSSVNRTDTVHKHTESDGHSH